VGDVAAAAKLDAPDGPVDLPGDGDGPVQVYLLSVGKPPSGTIVVVILGVEAEVVVQDRVVAEAARVQGSRTLPS
jgi:hypothetical protein